MSSAVLSTYLSVIWNCGFLLQREWSIKVVGYIYGYSVLGSAIYCKYSLAPAISKSNGRLTEDNRNERLQKTLTKITSQPKESNF